MSGGTTNVVVEAAHLDPVSMFRTGKRHRLPSRGRQAQRARRRPDDLRGRGGPGRRTARPARRRHRRGRRDGRGRAARAGDHHRSRHAAGHSDRHGHQPGDRGGAPARRRLRGQRRRRHADRGRAQLAAGPHRPVRPGRGGRPGGRLRRHPLGAARPLRPARPDHGPALRRRVGRTLAGAGFVEVVNFPFVGHRGLRPARSGRHRRPAYGDAAGQPAQRRGAADDHDPPAGAAQGARAQRGTRASPTPRCSRPRPSRCRAAAPRPRSSGRPSPDRGGVGRPAEGAAGPAAASRPRADRQAGAVGLVGQRTRGRLGRRHRGGAAVAAALGVEVAVRAASRAPWHPGRCAEISSARSSVGYAGELHPRVCAAYGVPPRTAVAEVDLDLLLERATPIVSGSALLDLPGGQGGRRPGRRRGRPGRRRHGDAPGGRGRAVRVGAAVRRLHRRAGRPGKAVAGLRAALPGAGPHADRGRGGARLATRRWPWPSSGTGAVHRRPDPDVPQICTTLYGHAHVQAHSRRRRSQRVRRG